MGVSDDWVDHSPFVVQAIDPAACDPTTLEGLAINRQVILTSSGPVPPVGEQYNPASRDAPWDICTDGIVIGALDGMVLSGETQLSGSPSVWLYHHSESGNRMRLEKSGTDLLFRAR